MCAHSHLYGHLIRWIDDKRFPKSCNELRSDALVEQRLHTAGVEDVLPRGENDVNRRVEHVCPVSQDGLQFSTDLWEEDCSAEPKLHEKIEGRGKSVKAWKQQDSGVLVLSLTAGTAVFARCRVYTLNCRHRKQTLRQKVVLPTYQTLAARNFDTILLGASCTPWEDAPSVWLTLSLKLVGSDKKKQKRVYGQHAKPAVHGTAFAPVTKKIKRKKRREEPDKAVARPKV